MRHNKRTCQILIFGAKGMATWRHGVTHTFLCNTCVRVLSLTTCQSRINPREGSERNFLYCETRRHAMSGIRHFIKSRCLITTIVLHQGFSPSMIVRCLKNRYRRLSACQVHWQWLLWMLLSFDLGESQLYFLSHFASMKLRHCRISFRSHHF